MEFLLQPLTLLTFFPLVGVLVILFMNSEQKNAIRWTALVTTLLTFGISLWVLTQFKAANPDLQLEAKYSWIQRRGLEHPILSRGGRLEHSARPADGLPHAHLHPLHVDSRRRPRQGFHDLLPAFGSGHDGRLPRAGPVPVLHLLGIHPRADVLPDRLVGRTAPHLCRGQVLPVHDGWFHLDVACHLWLGIEGNTFSCA